MSKKEPSGCASVIGKLLGSFCFASLVGGTYGQVMKSNGSLECDWIVLWVPAIIFWSILLLLLVLLGLITAAEKDK